MKERGISQKSFSEKTGIAQSTISDWKRKKTNPAADKILIICEVLNVSPYMLLFGEDKKLDYCVIDKETDEYWLIKQFNQFNLSYKNRLLGYAKALVEMYQNEENII